MSLVNAFDPEVIVVGGGVMGAVSCCRGRPARWWPSFRPARDHARIVQAHFAEEAGMLGAAVLALQDGAA